MRTRPSSLRHLSTLVAVAAVAFGIATVFDTSGNPLFFAVTAFYCLVSFALLYIICLKVIGPTWRQLVGMFRGLWPPRRGVDGDIFGVMMVFVPVTAVCLAVGLVIAAFVLPAPILLLQALLPEGP